MSPDSTEAPRIFCGRCSAGLALWDAKSLVNAQGQPTPVCSLCYYLIHSAWLTTHLRGEGPRRVARAAAKDLFDYLKNEVTKEARYGNEPLGNHGRVVDSTFANTSSASSGSNALPSTYSGCQDRASNPTHASSMSTVSENDLGRESYMAAAVEDSLESREDTWRRWEAEWDQGWQRGWQ